MSQRYFLPDHEELFDTYTREELRTMLLNGDISRSDIVVDDDTGLSHLLGDLLSRPLRNPTEHVVEERPKAYREFSVDSPLPARESPEEYYDDDEDEDDEMVSSSYQPQRPGPAMFEEYSPSRGNSLPREVVPEAPVREQVLHRLRPSWFSYPKLLFVGIVCAFVAGGCYREEAGLAYVMISGAVAAFCFVNISLDRSTTDYVITNKRVEAEFGIVGRSSKEVRICDIRAIDVTQDGVLALLGVGTVDFSSAGGTGVEVQFKNIRGPHKIKKIVRELQG